MTAPPAGGDTAAGAREPSKAVGVREHSRGVAVREISRIVRELSPLRNRGSVAMNRRSVHFADDQSALAELASIVQPSQSSLDTP